MLPARTKKNENLNLPTKALWAKTIGLPLAHCVSVLTLYIALTILATVWKQWRHCKLNDTKTLKRLVILFSLYALFNPRH